MHYTHYYNIIIFVQSPGSVVRRTRTHRSRCCIWNWRDLKMLLFWAICRLHEHQFNQLWVWYGLHEMCNRQKLILYLTRGKTIFGWYQSIHLMLWNFFKESRCFVFTYLLWIFLQKNWTSFSLFSSWSSMNLEQRKTWEEVFMIVYTKDDNSFNFY